VNLPAPTDGPGRITAIDHVGIAVADLDAAVELYTTAYGMTCVHTEVNEEQGVREAMMAVGDSGSYVQLLAPLSPDTTIGRFLERSGPGWTSSTSTPPALLGCTKFTFEPAVPVRGSS
jgi:methylmalonyl-CoA/ethylmalonyl-CoA epimerase